MNFLSLTRGTAPLILSLPHVGKVIPPDIERRLIDRDRALIDTDWRVDRLYAFASDLGVTLLGTAMSRTVVDVNRDPTGASLYPGQATTGLVPVETFDGLPLYRPGEEPDAADIADRRARWFDPYHAALEAEITRLRALHPRIVIYDAHSIRSLVPRLFEGELPVFNIGTNGGRSCDAGLTAAVAGACAATGLTMVVDGRFRGGHITRHHGRPERGVHAIQMELAQRFYLDEDEPRRPDPGKESAASSVLERVIGAALAWVRG